MKLELTDAQTGVLMQLLDAAMRAIGSQSQSPEVRDLWDKLQTAQASTAPETPKRK